MIEDHAGSSCQFCCEDASLKPALPSAQALTSNERQRWRQLPKWVGFGKPIFEFLVRSQMALRPSLR